MNERSEIERVVMRRVHIIRLLRPLLSPTLAAALVAIAALWGIGHEVWVAKVFANAPAAGLVPLARFYLAAFEHTRLSVQMLSLITLGSLIYLAREAAKPLAGVLVALFLRAQV